MSYSRAYVLVLWAVLLMLGYHAIVPTGWGFAFTFPMGLALGFILNPALKRGPEPK